MSVRNRTRTSGHFSWKAHHNRRQQVRDPGDRGHDQLARNRLALALDPAGQMRELLFGRLGHQQQVAPRLGRRIAPRVALEKLRPQPLFQRVDMADHRRMVHPQHLGRARYGAKARHVVSGADLVPVFHRATPSGLCMGAQKTPSPPTMQGAADRRIPNAGLTPAPPRRIRPAIPRRHALPVPWALPGIAIRQRVAPTGAVPLCAMGSRRPISGQTQDEVTRCSKACQNALVASSTV